jgi:hypothetical protein
MRRSVDQVIELIRFAGVAVAFVGVVVTVVRAAWVSLTAAGRQRIADVGLDLARTVLIGIDLLLVSAVLEVAVSVGRPDFTHLATVVGLRIGLTLLIAFEDAFRADSAERLRGRAGSWSWPKSLGRPWDRRPVGPPPAEPPVENVWPDRARLGRDWRRTAG